MQSEQWEENARVIFAIDFPTLSVVEQLFMCEGCHQNRALVNFIAKTTTLVEATEQETHWRREVVLCGHCAEKIYAGMMVIFDNFRHTPGLTEIEE